MTTKSATTALPLEFRCCRARYRNWRETHRLECAMKIIPVEKYESALVRLVDEAIQPSRNIKGSRYYMDLNRVVNRSFVDGIGTFIALAEETVVPWQLDWGDRSQGPDEARIKLGVHKSAAPDPNGEESRRQYDDLKALNEEIRGSDILSPQSLEYVTTLDLTTYPRQAILSWRKDIEKNQSEILRAYLTRLLNQIYTAPEITQSYLLIAEPDIQILGEIGTALAEGKLTTKTPLPRSPKSITRSGPFRSWSSKL